MTGPADAKLPEWEAPEQIHVSTSLLSEPDEDGHAFIGPAPYVHYIETAQYNACGEHAVGLSTENDRLASSLAERDRRVEALERALAVFADHADFYDGVPPPKYYGDIDFELRYSSNIEVSFTVGDLRNARAALSPAPLTATTEGE